ncbi:MAG: potassium-transporting ATPase subunit KdpC [Planctomycetaceae bacterium]
MSDIITSIRLFVSTLVVCSVGYTMLVLGFAQALFPEKSQGSLLTDDQGNVIGSELIAQSFSRPEYFWPRPSAVDYDASATGGSNLSPTNPAMTERAAGLAEAYQLVDGQTVTADLVTTSGSGLDPHIALAAAKLQMPRVANARGLSVSEVEQLVHQCHDAPALVALGGEPLINVLRLNIALDQQRGGQ